MKEYDPDCGEFLICDKQLKECTDKIFDIDGDELCEDCAFEKVYTLEQGEKYLFKPLPKHDYSDKLAVFSYMFSDEEVIDILKREYERVKNSGINGYMRCFQTFKECIKENANEDDFLEQNGYRCIQEGWD